MYIESLLIGGLAQGCLVALGAIGVTLLFRVSKFANVALGDMLTISAYCAYSINIIVPGNLPLLLFSGLIAGLVSALLIYILCFRTNAQPVTFFITSIGVALVLRATVLMVWGTSPRGYAGFQLDGRLYDAVPLSWSLTVVILACVTFGILFFYTLMHTQAGRLVRAVADDPALASTNGVNVHGVILGAWCGVGAIVGVAGVLLGLSSQLNPEMGWNLLLEMFAAAILGGLGNVRGAVLGAVVIGVATQLSIIFVSAQLMPAVALGIMIAMLLWRPTGLFQEVKRV